MSGWTAAWTCRSRVTHGLAVVVVADDAVWLLFSQNVPAVCQARTHWRIQVLCAFWMLLAYNPPGGRHALGRRVSRAGLGLRTARPCSSETQERFPRAARWRGLRGGGGCELVSMREPASPGRWGGSGGEASFCGPPHPGCPALTTGRLPRPTCVPGSGWTWGCSVEPKWSFSVEVHPSRGGRGHSGGPRAGVLGKGVDGHGTEVWHRSLKLRGWSWAGRKVLGEEALAQSSSMSGQRQVSGEKGVPGAGLRERGPRAAVWLVAVLGEARAGSCWAGRRGQVGEAGLERRAGALGA